MFVPLPTSVGRTLSVQQYFYMNVLVCVTKSHYEPQAVLHVRSFCLPDHFDNMSDQMLAWSDVMSEHFKKVIIVSELAPVPVLEPFVTL